MGADGKRNYIDGIALDIADRLGVSMDEYPVLLRLYALLALTVGEAVTQENVHDAWSAWQAGENRSHRSLVPFDELTVEVQNLDEKYRAAIEQAARWLREKPRAADEADALSHSTGGGK